MKRLLVLFLFPAVLSAIPPSFEPFSIPGRTILLPPDGYQVRYYKVDGNDEMLPEPEKVVRFVQRNGYLLRQEDSTHGNPKKTLIYYDKNDEPTKVETLDSSGQVNHTIQYVYQFNKLIGLHHFQNGQLTIREIVETSDNSVALRKLDAGGRQGSEVYRYSLSGLLMQHDTYKYSTGSWFGNAGEVLENRITYEYDNSGLLVRSLERNYVDDIIYLEDYFYPESEEIQIKRYQVIEGGRDRVLRLLQVMLVSGSDSTLTTPDEGDDQNSSEVKSDSKPEDEKADGENQPDQEKPSESEN